jgi:hypothetical protein
MEFLRDGDRASVMAIVPEGRFGPGLAGDLSRP